MKSKASAVIMFFVCFLIVGVTVLFGVILWNEYVKLNISADAETKDFKPTIADTSNISNTSDTIDKDIKTPKVVENPFDNIKDSNNNSNNNVDYSDVKINRFFYNQLDEESKTFYKGFEKNKDNMKSGTYKVEFGGAFSDILKQDGGSDKLGNIYQSAIEAYTYDNPDVFYLSPNKMYLNIETSTKANKTTYNVYMDSGKATNYLIDEFSSKSQVNDAISKIEQVRSKIVQNKKSDDYENIKMVHDYLIDNVEYDRTISKSNIYNIYGALVNGEAVCEGYARSFKYIMDYMGIQSTLVIGKGTNSEGKTENHAWNYIQVNGIYYAIDCTWDDPISTSGFVSSNSKYKYFLKGENEISKDHTPNGQFTEGGKLFEYPTLSKNNY